MKNLLKTVLGAAGAAAMVLTMAAPVFAMTDDEFTAATDAINAKYQSVYDAATKTSEDIKEDSTLCLVEFGFDAEWGLTKVSFDLPSVDMKMKEMKFNFLKIDWENKTILSTDVPGVRMKMRDFGFMKTKVPEFFTERIEVKTKVPTFRWDETSVKTKVPVVYKHRQEWKFNILKLKKLKELSAPCESEKQRGEQLSASVSTTAEQHKAELLSLSSGYLDTKLAELDEAITQSTAMFDEGLKGIDAAIADCRANNVDPAVIMTDIDGVQVSLLGAREQLEKTKAEAIAELEQSRLDIQKAKDQLAAA